MADYHAVLKRAIDALPDNTGAARRAVYQRARQAIVNQLKSYEPPLAPSDITKEQLQLEEAIRKVEADAARASLGLGPAVRTAPQAPRPPMPEQPAPGYAPQGPATPGQATGGQAAPGQPAPERPAPEHPAAEHPAPEHPVRPQGTGQAGAGAGQGAPQNGQGQGGLAPSPYQPVEPAMRSEPPAKAENGGKPEGSGKGQGASAHGNGEPFAAKPEKIEPAPPLGAGAFAQEKGGKDGAKGAGEPAAKDFASPSAGEVDRTANEPRFDAFPKTEKPAAGAQPGNGSGNGNGDLSGTGAGGRDAIADIDAMTRGAEAPTATGMPSYGRKRDLKPSRLPMIAAAVAAFIVFVALVSVAYTQRDAILAMFEADDAPQVSEEDIPAPITPSDPEAGKDTARLLNDDGSPAAPDARAVTTTRVTPPAEEDGVTVAPQGGEPDIAGDETPGEASGQSAAGEAGTAQQPDATPQATPVAQRAILYEESADASSGGSAEQGRVIWSTAEETPAGGDRADTVIKASVTIPGRDVTVDLTIRPNQDNTLPASHLIELRFNLPENFAGQGVSSVPGLIMKTTEEARGDALIGASVRVADGFFWVALSSIEAERERNITLLRDRGWIDIPVLYESGKRAILTLEKGSPGERVVETALEAWGAE